MFGTFKVAIPSDYHTFSIMYISAQFQTLKDQLGVMPPTGGSPAPCVGRALLARIRPLVGFEPPMVGLLVALCPPKMCAPNIYFLAV